MTAAEESELGAAAAAATSEEDRADCGEGGEGKGTAAAVGTGDCDVTSGGGGGGVEGRTDGRPGPGSPPMCVPANGGGRASQSSLVVASKSRIERTHERKGGERASAVGRKGDSRLPAAEESPRLERSGAGAVACLVTRVRPSTTRRWLSSKCCANLNAFWRSLDRPPSCKYILRGNCRVRDVRMRGDLVTRSADVGHVGKEFRLGSFQRGAQSATLYI